MRQANRFISINSSNLLISEQRRAALRFCTKRDTRKASDVPRKPKGFYLPGIDSVLIGQSPSRRDKDIRLFCFRSFFSASFRKIFVRIHPVVLPGFIPTDLLYHTFPDLSINRWLKIRIFFALSPGNTGPPPQTSGYRNCRGHFCKARRPRAHCVPFFQRPVRPGR